MYLDDSYKTFASSVPHDRSGVPIQSRSLCPLTLRIRKKSYLKSIPTNPDMFTDESVAKESFQAFITNGSFTEMT